MLVCSFCESRAQAHADGVLQEYVSGTPSHVSPFSVDVVHKFYRSWLCVDGMLRRRASTILRGLEQAGELSSHRSGFRFDDSCNRDPLQSDARTSTVFAEKSFPSLHPRTSLEDVRQRHALKAGEQALKILASSVSFLSVSTKLCAHRRRSFKDIRRRYTSEAGERGRLIEVLIYSVSELFGIFKDC